MADLSEMEGDTTHSKYATNTKQFFRPDQSTACIQYQTGRSHSFKRDDISECKTQNIYHEDPFVNLISLALIDSLWGEWKMTTAISSGLTSEHSMFYTLLKVNLEEEFYSGVQEEIKKKNIHQHPQEISTSLGCSRGH